MKHSILQLVTSAWFRYSILAIIIINAITMGLETSKPIMAEHGAIIHGLDRAILSIFVIEILLKLYAFGWRFFKSAWNVFDIIVVGIALIPAAGAFSALRTLRVLRVLRIVSSISSMRRVVEGLLISIPGIISVACILLIIFYIFAVIGTNLYGETHPEWFGSIGATMFSLFQIMTLESWSMGIVRPLMETHPNAWLFFVLYILVASFTMFNLFVAIIVNSLQSESEKEAQAQREEVAAENERLIRESEKRMIKAFKQEMKSLK